LHAQKCEEKRLEWDKVASRRDAANDLLAACKAALPKLSDDYVKNLVEAAIAKAEGKS